MDDETRLRVALDMLKEVIERDVEIPLKTFGLSMRPVICDGDWIVVRRAIEAEIRMGDIIIYQAGQEFIAHRVIQCRTQGEQVYFKVKGDAHLASEGVIPAGRMIARVVALKKQGRAINMDQPAWQRANRLIARYSSAVDFVYRRLPFCPDRTSLAGRILTAVVRLPTRLLMFAWKRAVGA